MVNFQIQRPGRDGSNLTTKYAQEFKDAFVLGAGFSRAFSQQFPLADELGNAVLSRLHRDDANGTLPKQQFSNGGFEVWLSRLAEEQPYRRAASNADAAALFSHVTELLHKIMVENQSAALSGASPDWFWELLSLLQTRLATVITFNYDNLIEWGVNDHLLYPGQESSSNVSQYAPGLIKSWDILDNLPHLPQAASSQFRSPRQTSFRLLKLHGSLSWYWSPGDTSGATLERWEPDAGRYEDIGKEEDERTRRSALPGREPFIVPPTAIKSAYFRNPVTREIWTRAFEALKDADRWIFVGYSLPPGDLTVRGMLAEVLSQGATPEVAVVDICPEPVVKQLEAIGFKGQVDKFGGIEAIASFVKSYISEQANSVVLQLRMVQGDEGTLHVSWRNSGQYSYQVQRIELEQGGERVVLHLESAGKPFEVRTKQFAELRQFISESSKAKCLTAKFEDGRCLELIQADLINNEPGKNRVVQLTPAGKYI